MKINPLIVILSILILIGCSKEYDGGEEGRNTSDVGQWLVPFEDILYWGDPVDEILSIDDPQFSRVSESNWHSEDRMLVQYYDEEIRAYPVNILEGHEIVNDRISDYHYAVSYCPITGSGMSWNRTIEGEVTEFGVSGMLYQENLVPYDRNTGSYWSQMLMLCIHGELIETEPQTELFLETDFGLLANYFPDAEVLVAPGLYSSHQAIASPQYKDQQDEIDPGVGSSDKLSSGEYYYGAISRSHVLIFPLDLFGQGPRIYVRSLRGKQLVIVGSKEKNYVVSFEIHGRLGKGMNEVPDHFPVIMEDIHGNQFNIFGKVVSGPDAGAELKAAKGYRAKGFAWDSIFTSLEVFGE